jgi:RNA recognition motif-containing protein
VLGAVGPPRTITKCLINYAYVVNGHINFFIKEHCMHGSKLYVGNLSYSITSEKLKELFATYGTVVDVRIIGDKGFGFVEMSNQAEAENAKNELDGQSVDGRNIRVDEARQRTDKKSGGRNFRQY